MGGQSKLVIIALIVSIFVIIGLTIVFCFLFFLYSFYKSKHIKFGFEDEELNKEITTTLYKVNSKRLKKNKSLLRYNDIIKNEHSLTTKLHIFMNIISSVVIAILTAIFITALVYRVNNDNLFIGNSTYMTILTSSMECRNEKNEYLDEYNLDDQILQYSLVGVEKIEKEEDLKLYDIVAYEYEEIVILHRIVAIKIDEETNKTIYTLKGDANESSLNYEKELEFEDFIGKYNGFQNYGLGVTITYVKSNIGIIAILSAAIFLFLTTFAEDMINKEYKNRLSLLADDKYLIVDLKELAKSKYGKKKKVEEKEDEN